MKKLKIYVGCSLAYASQEYRDAITLFKKELATIPFIEILEFCPPPPGESQSSLSAAEVYINDINNGVGKAHLVIAEVSLPSSGLGFEIAAAALKYEIPIMMFAKNHVTVSKILIGVFELTNNIDFFWYKESITEYLPTIKHQLEVLYNFINSEK